MNVGLESFSISQSVFLEKVGQDLGFGVRIKGAKDTGKDVVRVWTDTEKWQFSLVGLIDDEQVITVEKVEIQSFGSSVQYMKLIAIHSEPELEIDLQKLSPNFAELAEVTADEAKLFMEGYMQSSVNRTLTQQLFTSFANEKDVQHWLSL